MTSPETRIRQLFLVALSADHAGEKLAALDRLQNTLSTMGRDAHWLVGRLNLQEDPFEEYARQKFERFMEDWLK